MPHVGLLSRLDFVPAARGVLIVGGVITLAIFLLCGTVVLDGRNDASRQADEAAENIATALAQDIARNIELYDLSLQAVVHGLQLPDIWTLDPDLRRMILFDRAAGARHFGFINVLNEAGEVILDSRAKPPRFGSFASRDYFQFHRNDPRNELFIGRPFLTGPDQPATIPLSRRLVTPDGNFAGVVVGTIRLASIREAFSTVSVGTHGTITLLHRDGYVLMRLPFSQDDVGHAPAPDPVPRRTTAKRVGDVPLVVSVGLADDDIYAPWRRKAAAVMATVAALCTLLAGGIGWLWRTLDRQAAAEAAARRSRDEMARFTATISHELRTPLTSILGYAELLADDDTLRPEQIGRLAALTGSGAHMRDVINRVLDITHPDALANPPRCQDTDLDALIARCRGQVVGAAQAKGLRLSCHLAPDLPRSAMIDAAQVCQILVNLLSNAVKYTETGSVDLHVSGRRGVLRLEVADTGPGIPAARRPRLFQAYDRLDAGSGVVEGSGIGLWIAARLVAGMDGRIGYGDNPGGGSIFWVEIPLGMPGLAPTPAAETSADAAPPLRLLLADDSPLNRDISGCFLRAAGHTVVEAEDGEAAVRQVQATPFDLVLMDMRMPGMNGLEAARQIRALPPPRGSVPIVVVTADLTVSHQDAYREAGIDGHLAKPFTGTELLRTVDAFAAKAGSAAPPVVGLPLLDDETLEHLASRMSADNVDACLRTLAGRIDDLLRLLRQPDAGDDLRDLAHDMQGSTGVLGCAALGAALHRFEAGEDRPGSDRAELLAIAERSRDLLRQRLTGANGNCVEPPPVI